MRKRDLTQLGSGLLRMPNDASVAPDRAGMTSVMPAAGKL
jgi:hypothetical protein